MGFPFSEVTINGESEGVKRFLSPKGGMILVLAAALLAVGVAYATHQVFDVNLTGNVQLSISATDPLQVFSGDGVTQLNSGDAINFGAADVDFWGTGPVPTQRVLVVNTSNTVEQVVVTGDGGDGVVPVFGPTPEEMVPWPDHVFLLQRQGISGDRMWGYLGLTPNPPKDGV